jgi:hypothetical protein
MSRWDVVVTALQTAVAAGIAVTHSDWVQGIAVGWAVANGLMFFAFFS